MHAHLSTPARARTAVALGLTLAAWMAASCAAAGAAQDATVIRVGPFTGDSHIADAVTETLLTDLARSDHLVVLDGRAARPAPHDNTQEVSSASLALTGSCLPHDGAVVINIRGVDPATGRTVPGLAMSVDGPRASVLTLAHSIATRLAPKLAARSVHPEPRNAPRAASVVIIAARPPAPKAAPAPQEEFTGLIVDARGLGLERSMSPSLRRKDGSVVWNGAEASPDYVIDEGIVQYAATMEQAIQHARAGARPLVLTASGRWDTPFASDPLLSDDDAARLLAAAKHDSFLKKFRVVFVIGK